MNFAMATLNLKEMGEFLPEGREKSLSSWLSQSQFSFASFKPEVAIAKFIGKTQKKRSGIMKSGLDAIPLFLQDYLLKYL